MWVDVDADLFPEPMRCGVLDSGQVRGMRQHPETRGLQGRLSYLRVAPPASTAKNSGTRETNRPLLLLHGYSGGKMVWAGQLEALSRVHELYVPDLPGWGLSMRPPCGHMGAAEVRQWMVESVLGFCDAVGLDRGVQMGLVGHSLGGWLGAEVALADPERLRGGALVQLNPVGLSDAPTWPEHMRRPLWMLPPSGDPRSPAVGSLQWLCAKEPFKQRVYPWMTLQYIMRSCGPAEEEAVWLSCTRLQWTTFEMPPGKIAPHRKRTATPPHTQAARKALRQHTARPLRQVGRVISRPPPRLGDAGGWLGSGWGHGSMVGRQKQQILRPSSPPAALFEAAAEAAAPR